MRIFTLLALALSFALPLRAQPAGADTILIVAMSPDKFEDGKETAVEVTVAYELDSFDEAVIDVNANQLWPQSFSTIGKVKVKRGTGTVTIPGKLIPRYWTPSTPARVAVSLRGGVDPLVETRIVAHDETRVSVARRAHPSESDPENPNPTEVYHDKITISSVSPETLAEGQEIEVTVTVAYELLSREQGEINLGFSEGRGNGYTIVGSTVIKIGTGDAVVKARIIPQRTGKLPFAKIFVNLSEYPHRKAWSPLANDSHTVEVR